MAEPEVAESGQSTSPGSHSTPALAVADQAREFCALAKTDRRQAEDRFSLLPVERQRNVVLAVDPEQRLDLLLLATDTGPLVQSLPEIELLRTVQTVGKWEAQEIIEVASEEQINFMLDHDCWRGERLDSRKVTDWLALFLDCDDDQVFRLLTAINADLLALILKKHIHFDHDIMVDDTYYCDPDWVHGSNPTVDIFLQRLYALDPNLWIRLLGWVRTHSKPTIEADAIEGREARLRGKGFPAPTLAITVYYPVDFDVPALLAAWHEVARRVPEPGLRALADSPRTRLFLERLVAAVAEANAEDTLCGPRLEADLVNLANKVMVADQVDIGDLRRQREAVDKVRRWTSLGLETAAAESLPAGIHLLREQTLEYGFRLGSMLFDALATAIVELVKAEQRSGGRVLESDLAEVYVGLVEPEPRLPGADRGGTPRTIASLAEYRYAWSLVWQLGDLLATAPHPTTDPGALAGAGGERAP